MPWDNRLNTGKGRDFQRLAAKALERHFQVPFVLEQKIPIGDPPKEHKFDLVSEDRRYIGESKNYSWTETGNMPSAKMGFVNEAVFYLSFLPDSIQRFVIMRNDLRRSGGETLAEYYYRTYRHLLGRITVLELDVPTRKVRQVGP